MDADAAFVPLSTALWASSIMFSFLIGLFGLVVLSDPVGSNPVAVRSTVIPYGGLNRERGFAEAASEDDEED